MFPPEFPQETSGPAFAALRRGRQCCSGGGACPELVERISRAPRSPTSRRRRSRFGAQEADLRPPTFAERGRASAASRAAAVREGGPVTPERSVGGFTLLELLVVMGIILIALAALVPAVTSLSKSGGRRAALNSLLGGIEQARAEAIKSSQATYVVFPAFTSGTQSTLDRYNYRSYAIFEDDAAIPGNVKQLTDWKSFPTGVALRAAGTAALSNLADPATLTPSVAFSFAPDTSAAPFKCFKFNSNGEVQTPAGNVLLAIFEGYVNSGSEVATTKDGSGNPSAVEYLMVSQFTGRAEPTASP
jgi:prepilin-type N-terminal cleavage/methylation domain-containing protein